MEPSPKSWHAREKLPSSYWTATSAAATTLPSPAVVGDGQLLRRRLHLNTPTPLTQRSRSGLTMPLPSIMWEPIRKRAHTQLVRDHSVTVGSARWATVDWSWPKERNLCARANFHFTKKKKKRSREMNCRSFSQHPGTRGRSHHQPSRSVVQCAELFILFMQPGNFPYSSSIFNWLRVFYVCDRKYTGTPCLKSSSDGLYIHPFS